eukprot:1195602-Prorocentrum_minimum.AAC.2
MSYVALMSRAPRPRAASGPRRDMYINIGPLHELDPPLRCPIDLLGGWDPPPRSPSAPSGVRTPPAQEPDRLLRGVGPPPRVGYASCCPLPPAANPRNSYVTHSTTSSRPCRPRGERRVTCYTNNVTCHTYVTRSTTSRSKRSA